MENLFLDSCSFYVQLPSGNWAGDSFIGFKVSIDTFEQNERPSRFKYELARMATPEETTWLNQEKNRIEGIATGECMAADVDMHSGVELYGSRKIPIEKATWNPNRRQWEYLM